MEACLNLKSLIPISPDRSIAANPFMPLQREIDRLFDDFTRGFPTLADGANPTAARQILTRIVPCGDVRTASRRYDLASRSLRLALFDRNSLANFVAGVQNHPVPRRQT
jgi:hypothetical protein